MSSAPRDPRVARLDNVLTGEQQKRIRRAMAHVPMAAHSDVPNRSWVVGPRDAAMTGDEIADWIVALSVVLAQHFAVQEQEDRDALEHRRWIAGFRALAGAPPLERKAYTPDTLDDDIRQRYDYARTSREGL